MKKKKNNKKMLNMTQINLFLVNLLCIGVQSRCSNISMYCFIDSSSFVKAAIYVFCIPARFGHSVS